jgi:hypothetical protein
MGEKMVMVHSLGQMEESILGIGRMGRSMVMELTLTLMEVYM